MAALIQSVDALGNVDAEAQILEHAQRIPEARLRRQGDVLSSHAIDVRCSIVSSSPGAWSYRSQSPAIARLSVTMRS